MNAYLVFDKSEQIAWPSDMPIPRVGETVWWVHQHEVLMVAYFPKAQVIHIGLSEPIYV